MHYQPDKKLGHSHVPGYEPDCWDHSQSWLGPYQQIGEFFSNQNDQSEVSELLYLCNHYLTHPTLFESFALFSESLYWNFQCDCQALHHVISKYLEDWNVIVCCSVDKSWNKVHARNWLFKMVTIYPLHHPPNLVSIFYNISSKKMLTGSYQFRHLRFNYIKNSVSNMGCTWWTSLFI